MMVYVDDVFAVGEGPILKALIGCIQQEWKTSDPEWVSGKPVRFLGMEIQKEDAEEKEGSCWKASQVNYTNDLLRRNLGEDEKKWIKRKIPMTRDGPSEIQRPPTPEEVREAQRVTGELLWLVTRSRPDLMFPVAKMSAKVLHNPIWVVEAAQQVWGYLANTEEDGLLYQPSEEMKPWEEGAGLQAFSDASFSPGGEESHGSIAITLRGGLLVWRSAKQSTVTLSTAEAELNEVIEGLMLGESVAAILEEMDQGLKKEMISDSQAAVNICMAEGGSWRTRHLRLRASHARQRFVKGDWVLRHFPGEEMLADIGAKPLASTRLNYLKELMGMTSRKKSEVKEDVEEERERIEEKTQEKKDIPQVEMMLRMVVLLASFQSTRAQGKNEEDGGVGWVVVVVAWGVFLMAVGLVAIIRWTMNIIRTMVMGKERKEPEEEPQDEGEEESGDGRRMRRRVISNPQSREETPLPSPVPNIRREGGAMFTPSPQSSRQRDGRPGSSADGTALFPNLPPFPPNEVPIPPGEEPVLEDYRVGLQVLEAGPVQDGGNNTPGALSAPVGNDGGKGYGKGKIKGKSVQEMIQLAVDDPDPVTRSYYECTLRNHGIDVQDMRSARRNPGTPTTATMSVHHNMRYEVSRQQTMLIVVEVCGSGIDMVPGMCD